MPILLQGGNKVAECNHVFIGKVDGVHCTKCSLHMSASEYVKLFYTKSEKTTEKPKRQQRKKVKTDE